MYTEFPSPFGGFFSQTYQLFPTEAEYLIPVPFRGLLFANIHGEDLRKKRKYSRPLSGASFRKIIRKLAMVTMTTNSRPLSGASFRKPYILHSAIHTTSTPSLRLKPPHTPFSIKMICKILPKSPNLLYFQGAWETVRF